VCFTAIGKAEFTLKPGAETEIQVDRKTENTAVPGLEKNRGLVVFPFPPGTAEQIILQGGPSFERDNSMGVPG
jgi:hypothetical protein